MEKPAGNLAGALLLVMSFLAALSALGAELKSNQEVFFFPGLAWSEGDHWRVEIHGWVYEKEEHKFYSSLFRRALGLNAKNLTAQENAILQERSQLFLEDNKRRKTMMVTLGGMNYKVGPSRPNGHFTTQLSLNSDAIRSLTNKAAAGLGMVGFSLDNRARTNGGFAGVIHVLNPTGISVVSDIDDTIKISNVGDRKELLQNTMISKAAETTF